MYLHRLKVKTILCSSLIILYSTSCKKFVQIAPPNTLIVTADVFDNNVTATAAMTSIYTQMFNNAESWTIGQDQGLLADELTSYSTDPTQIQFYTNNMIATNSSGEWLNAYNYIYQANAMIEGVENNNNITPIIAQQLTGEAKFVRAFWLFYLTNQYGDVPLVTSTLYSTNAKVSRTAQSQVYLQIIQDLQDAQVELNSNYVDATDTAITNERTRPAKAAAEAFLARVYLYTRRYDSAEEYASMVINNPLYSLCVITPAPAITNGTFLKNSKEAIWQLYTPLPTSINTNDAQNFNLMGAAPTTGDAQSVTISPQLLGSFEANDFRRMYWIDSFSTGNVPNVTYYYPNKYQITNTGNVTEYTMVFRLAEQYLIRAEAETQQGNLSAAASDLNIIRSRANLSNISGTIASSQSALLAAILHERQVELFTEWGHRWFDLIRTGNINQVMSIVTPIKSYGTGTVSWVSTDSLYPIPQSEILIDPNLTQNAGY
jgi:starch-binding outer membrane protein, SusD/RagB family